jgi:DNA ligase
MATAQKISSTYDSSGELVFGQWEIQGSGKNPYKIMLKDKIWSCDCPAWRNQSKPIDERVCKHTAQVIAVALGKSVLVPSGAVRQPVKQNAAEKAFSDKVTLAHVYTDQDVIGWLASEKLDGVRCIWLPNEKVLLSRNGKQFHAPDWFLKAMPSYPIDGELWMGRGKFQETVSIVRQGNGGDAWLPIMFMAFDLFVPARVYFQTMHYMDRYKWMQNMGAKTFSRRKTDVSGQGIQPLSDRAFVLPQQLVSDTGHLATMFTNVQNLGGEGLMLRKPGVLYETGRSHNLLKYKKMLDDVATVIDMEEGEGRHKGTMGALVCVLPSGVQFKIGTGFTDQQRNNWWLEYTQMTAEGKPIKDKGYIVEFTYQELTNDGVPRFPAFQRVRLDLTSAAAFWWRRS